MNLREAYLQTLLFGTPDKIPLQPGGGRESTRRRWYQEGLPEGMTGSDIISEALRQAGIKEELPQVGAASFGVSDRMNPVFEEKVIERQENSQVVQDWKGNICEIGLEFDVTYLRTAHDFCTRRWIKCPVESKSDWLEMMKRYDANDPLRMPPEADRNKIAEQLKHRTWNCGLNISGPYWQLREWCGFEGLCMMFYDNPALVEEMIDFWKLFIGDLLKNILQYYTPDEIHLSEDMAYKGHSMLSPEMTRQFLQPCWNYWGEIIRNAGIPIYSMDSDGCIDELIPIWIESGINVCDPIEVAAGNDIVEFRKRFGRNIAYRGGVDKREMARGGARLEAEIERIMPVIKDGGYIPGCDHGVPSDVSWPNFVHCVKLLAQASGWK